LAEAMVPLLEDGVQRTWMGGRGRQLVAAGYTWTKIAARVVDVYRQVAQRMESRMSRSPQC
jgi:glycosyltransferase involved in cell wall biosynthesis